MKMITSNECKGRTLHLLDVENLGRGPECEGSWLAWVLDRFRRTADWGSHDHAIGAASTRCYKRVCFHLTGIRFLPAGGGSDAADLRLIEETDTAWTADHYGRVVFGSGDHIYAGRARELQRLGVTTWAVGWRDCMSAELRRAVDVVRYLDDDDEPRAGFLRAA